MKKLNVAIIGQGRSGRDIHGNFFLSGDNKLFNVVAVVDALEIRRNRANEEYKCDVYSDYKELFSRDDIDLVVNSTYSHMHPTITLDLLKHKFNVVVEKPFAMYESECAEMINASEENNVMLTVFQQSRFAPYYTKIKDIIKSGVLGRLVQVELHFSGYQRRWDWQCSQRYYGGSVLNTGPHPIDQALDILGYENHIPNIFSKLDMVNTYGDAEDYAKIIFTAPNQPLVDVEISSADAYSDFVYKIQGDRGSLISTMKECQWKYFVAEDEEKHELILGPIMNKAGHPGYCEENLKWHEFKENIDGDVFDTGTKNFYKNVYEHLTDGTPLVVTPQQIKKEISVIEKIHSQNPFTMKF